MCTPIEHSRQNENHACTFDDGITCVCVCVHVHDGNRALTAPHVVATAHASGIFHNFTEERARKHHRANPSAIVCTVLYTSAFEQTSHAEHIRTCIVRTIYRYGLFCILCVRHTNRTVQSQYLMCDKTCGWSVFVMGHIHITFIDLHETKPNRYTINRNAISDLQRRLCKRHQRVSLCECVRFLLFLMSRR